MSLFTEGGSFDLRPREAELAGLLGQMSVCHVPPMMQQGIAERACAFIESVMSGPSSADPISDGEWMARRYGDHFSLMGPGALIAGSLSGVAVCSVRFDGDGGWAWQIDTEAAFPVATADLSAPRLRVRVSQGTEVLSDWSFERDGRSVDNHDWSGALREGFEEVQKALEDLGDPSDLDLGPLPVVPPPVDVTPSASGDMLSGAVAGDIGEVPATPGSPVVEALAAGAGAAAVGWVAARVVDAVRRQEPPAPAPPSPPPSAPASLPPAPVPAPPVQPWQPPAPAPAGAPSSAERPPLQLRHVVPPGLQQAEAPSSRPVEPPRLCLVEVEGPKRGASYALADRMRLGREVDNDVVGTALDVSRHHAEIRLEKGAWVLHDVGSSVGTTIDGVRVSTGVPLREGMRLQLASWTLGVARVPDVAPAAPTAAAARRCGICGEPVAADGRFCETCGARLS